MEEKWYFTDSMAAVRLENIPVRVTTIKLTKKNYLTWAVVVKMGITGRGRVNYINGKMKQPGEDVLSWIQ